MRIGGTGGANTNASGKPFEECFRPTGTRLIGGKSFTYFTQDDFVVHMRELKDPQWNHKKKPDGALVSEDNKTVFIIECKHQIVAGSVDEKIRGGPCLLAEYKQLYPTVENFHLMFVLNDWWFKQKKYEIPIRFNEEYGIPIFFAKHGSKWKIHFQNQGDKWTIYPAFYSVDEDVIFEWMTTQVLRSS